MPNRKKEGRSAGRSGPARPGQMRAQEHLFGSQGEWETENPNKTLDELGFHKEMIAGQWFAVKVEKVNFWCFGIDGPTTLEIVRGRAERGRRAPVSEPASHAWRRRAGPARTFQKHHNLKPYVY